MDEKEKAIFSLFDLYIEEAEEFEDYPYEHYRGKICIQTSFAQRLLINPDGTLYAWVFSPYMDSLGGSGTKYTKMRVALADDRMREIYKDWRESYNLRTGGLKPDNQQDFQ